MDAYGHVNNAQFARLLEEARIAWFTLDDGRSMVDNGLIVANLCIDYLAPLTYRPEPVAVDVWACDQRGSSITVCYEVRDISDAEVVYARASTVMVAFDLRRGRPRHLHSWERDRVQQHSGDPVVLRTFRVGTS
jgi:acyl-CoA thioester hydrolase